MKLLKKDIKFIGIYLEVKIIIAIDRISRSTIWYDVTTNVGVRHLVEFIASKHLQIINEEIGSRIFNGSRGQSNITLPSLAI